MSIRTLPEGATFQRPQNLQWDAPSDVLAKWAEVQMAAAEDGADNTISMFDVIGEDWWTGAGVTAKRVSAALRSIGNKDVVVNLNSPGGDAFEGIAIYNLLRAHPAKVTVNVLGLAASAASIIAMAGDQINMGLGSLMMVHNAWGVTVGNRHDLRDAASRLEEIDAALADIYEARTGVKRAEIVKLMDAETFMGASDAVKNKFADAVDEGLSAKSDTKNSSDRSIMARRQVEATLAKAGYSRDRRSEMLSEMGVPKTAQRDASRQSAARDAGTFEALAKELISILK